MNTQFSLRKLVAIFLFSIFTLQSQAVEPVSKGYFDDIAIDGRDTVAYHKPENIAEHRTTDGIQSWKAEWKGAIWLFTSEADRDLFAANPEQYAPAYNGHCANALTLGEGLIKTDGTHWQIFDKQLYTFYAARGRDRWMAADDIKAYKDAADKAWNEILNSF